MKNKEVVVSVVMVLLLFFSGILIFSYQNSLDLTGYTITGNSGVQCDDTDNTHPFEGPRSEQSGTDNIFEKGGVRTKAQYGEWSNLIYDSCSRNVLTETFCTGSGRVSSKTVTCENGCSDGKCNLPQCLDSDGPRAFTVKGSATGAMISDPDFVGVPSKVQTSKVYTDACKSRLVLTEYYCAKNLVKKRTMSCPSVGSNMICSQGACVAPNSA